MEPLLVDKKTAARLLSISVRKLEYLISSKELHAQRIGRRVLLSYRKLQRFVAGQ